MREAIGGSQLLMIIIVLVIVIMMLLAGSIGYSKAFKARNAIVNIVQENGGYGISVEKMFNDYGAEEQIADILNDMGYKTSIGTKGCSCDDINSDVYECLDSSNSAQYNFCIYHLEDTQTGNQLYKVKTYMYFELPIFGRNDMFAIPIYADTYSFLKYGI